MSGAGPRPTETVLTSARLRDWAMPESGGGKEGRGRLLVVGGARSTPGAVLLAAEAAMRAGAGKLQVATVASTAVPLALALPEGMVEGLPEGEDGDISPAAAERVLELTDGCDTVLLGPGASTPDSACALLEGVLPELDAAGTTVVLDALAMAYLTEHRDGLHRFDGRAVVSPNLREMARTLGIDSDDCSDDPLPHIAELARQTRAVVVSGAATTWIVPPGGESGAAGRAAWRDESGVPGLGTSGAGDVKAGVIAGLLVRGAEPVQAAAWATYAHGRAGERLAAGVGPTGFLARELLAEIPRVLVELTS